MKFLAALLIAVTLSGCSFAFGRHSDPQRRADSGEPACRENALPMLDLALVVGAGVGVLFGWMAVVSESDAGAVDDSDTAALVVTGGSAVIAVTGVASMVYGLRKNSRCRRAHAAPSTPQQ